jgi:hypothetical protein
LIESVNRLLGKVAATRRSDHLTGAEIAFENGRFFGSQIERLLSRYWLTPAHAGVIAWIAGAGGQEHSAK